jgi:hypothetical protein
MMKRSSSTACARCIRRGAEVVSGTTGDALLDAMGETGRCPDLIVADYRLAHGELGTDVVSRLRRGWGRRSRRCSSAATRPPQP